MTQQILHVNSLADITDRRPTYLVLGSFDGVHRGHQAILKDLVGAAQSAGCVRPSSPSSPIPSV